jgi:hypothetical protein
MLNNFLCTASRRGQQLLQSKRIYNTIEWQNLTQHVQNTLLFTKCSGSIHLHFKTRTEKNLTGQILDTSNSLCFIHWHQLWGCIKVCVLPIDHFTSR